MVDTVAADAHPVPVPDVGAPDGPEIGAFFDLDGTLIDGYSAAVMYRDRFRRGDVGLDELGALWSASQESPMSEETFEHLLTTAAAGWKGRPVAEFDEWGERMAREEIFSRLFHAAWQRVRAHLRRGHTVAIATSATRFQVAPLARELGVEHVLCTEFAIDDDGLLTGALRGRTGWGEGKAALVSRFAEQHGIDLDRSWAYANGDEDVPFLSAVGRPVAVNPQPELAGVVAERGWPVLEFTRASAPVWDVRPWLRTAALYGSLVVSSGVGLAHGLLTGDRRGGVDLGEALLGPLGQLVASIEVDVAGEEHLWSHRPAVFLINHQSALIDVVVTTRLLRDGFTAVMKREVRDTPVLGWFMARADIAFVDRSAPGAAAVLDEAAAKLHDGVSVVMAPEGTRSTTPSVGRFKKGAFRLAAQAGVPLVPIVIRNAGELMWRDTYSAHPGRVQVHVHPPIPTDGWGPADVDAAVTEVRTLYVDTLEQWPVH